MALKLLRNDIAVVPIEDPERTDSGLYVPDQAKQRPDNGIVKYLGPECEILSRGDHVIFGGYVGNRLALDDEGMLILMRETDVAAVHEETSERFVLLSEALNATEEIRGDAHIRFDDEEMVDTIVDSLQSKLADYFREKGLRF